MICGCYGRMVKVHFTMDVPTLKYKIDGNVFVDIPVYGIDLLQDITANFNGTLKDDKGADHFTEGSATVPDPPLSNLDKIKMKGHYASSPANINFEAKASVSIWDILKPKIPFKGHIVFSDGKEGDFNGLVDRPTRRHAY